MSHESCECHSSNHWSRSSLDELDFERGIWSHALSGDLSKVEGVLRKNPEASNSLDSSGLSALHYAARSGHAAIVSLLLKTGKARVDPLSPSGSSTPLHRAAYMGHLDIVQLLLDHGADPHLTDSDGNNALHKSSEKKTPQSHGVFKYLANRFPSLIERTNKRGIKPSSL
eukprot:TRINITY_DN25524_c0_g1_i1.p1 TRINITY_DN25524_c0_g1~~TRINITY_DN25524_c0_g1_i1.p1  ORF type:complete len:179 (+),score=19.43 TRINITY_DN25524_c0_g1_i1:29-538(+)